MRRSVDEFRRTAKDVESRLDMLQWKVETLSQNAFSSESSRMNSPQPEPVSVSQLLKDLSKMKNDYTSVKQELREVLDQQTEACNQLNERMDSVKERFLRLKEVVGEPQE